MYLYIFDGGEVRQDLTGPTNNDLECIRHGVLRVFYSQRDDTGRTLFLEIDAEDVRRWIPIPKAVMTDHGRGEGLFHDFK